MTTYGRCLDVNEGGTRCVLGTGNGILVVGVDPQTLAVREEFRRVWEGRTVRAAAGYGASNIVFVVFSEEPQSFSVWDDRAGAFVATRRVGREICGLRVAGERLYVCHREGVRVVSVRRLEACGDIACRIAHGGREVCFAGGAAYYPAGGGADGGACGVYRWDGERAAQVSAGGAPLHDMPVACAAMSADGTLLATTSETGTNVRVWTLWEWSLHKEFRRGADITTVWSMQFSPDNRFLALFSARRTVHLFSLSKSAPGGWLSAMMPGKGEKSVASFSTPVDAYGRLVFSRDSSRLLLISETGYYTALDISESPSGSVSLSPVQDQQDIFLRL